MEKMIDRFGSFYKKSFFEYVLYDALKMYNKMTVSMDYIIHSADNEYSVLLQF